MRNPDRFEVSRAARPVYTWLYMVIWLATDKELGGWKGLEPAWPSWDGYLFRFDEWRRHVRDELWMIPVPVFHSLVNFHHQWQPSNIKHDKISWDTPAVNRACDFCAAFIALGPGDCVAVMEKITLHAGVCAGAVCFDPETVMDAEGGACGSPTHSHIAFATKSWHNSMIARL
ncbi:hypothetical protein E2P81_ATG10705 [Venturia nashicola]|nr:hypothetical protein E2P81_ATG10705 [Venturia nashicola]